MRKGLFILLLLMLFVGCKRQHVFHTYYGDIDIDTMEIALYDLKDSLPCYIVKISNLDSIEKAPGIWGYIKGPLYYYYCPDKNTYYTSFPDNQGRQVLRGLDPYNDYSCRPDEI